MQAAELFQYRPDIMHENIMLPPQVGQGFTNGFQSGPGSRRRGGIGLLGLVQQDAEQMKVLGANVHRQSGPEEIERVVALHRIARFQPVEEFSHQALDLRMVVIQQFVFHGSSARRERDPGKAYPADTCKPLRPLLPTGKPCASFS